MCALVRACALVRVVRCISEGGGVISEGGRVH